MSSLSDIENGNVDIPTSTVIHEIPPAHWSYKLAQKLAIQSGLEEKDILLDGNKALTRTEMAVLVSDLTQKLAAVPEFQVMISEKDRGAFEILQAEFQNEVKLLRARIEKVETSVDHLSARVDKAIKEDEKDDVTEVHATRGPIRIFGQLHAWYSAPFNDELADRNFRLRRANIGVEGDLNKDWQYKLMFDPVRNDRILKDMTLEYTRIPHHTVRIGQFRPGTTWDTLRSSSANFTSERSQIGVITNVREQGAQIVGEWKYLTYRAGVYNGNGDNHRTDDNRRLAFGGRVDVRPLLDLLDEEKWGFLQLGASVFTGNVGGADRIEDRDRYSATARYVHKKFEINSEYMRLNDRGAEGDGYYVEAVYKLNPRWNVAARYDVLNPNRNLDDTQKQYILAVNHLIDKYHVRLALEYLRYTDPLELNKGNAVRLLVQHTF